ncbi:MAG TPA: acyl-CoA dehydrogenase family protein [Candidatus Angelobacter sp.]|nr:acyl-CoA dehydrogenase family protein [Candidatus Angelobacter sp.]
MPAAFQTDATSLFRLCFELLHGLGGISPATALAVENHFYVTSAIATFPTANDPVMDRNRDLLINSICDRRMLVANTNSKIHGNKLGDIGTHARREEHHFRINGKAAYTSLATQGDLLVLLTEIAGEGHGFFAIDNMQGNPAVEIGAYLFPSAMLDSDTRQIIFHDLVVPHESLLAGGKGQDLSLLISFEMAWHQLLIPALYLGAAARAIEEVRKFLHATQGRDNRPLAELDGMIVDVGRLAIDYSGACSAVWRAGDALGEVKDLPRDARLLERAVDLASHSKYIGTKCSEAIVTAARRIIGARSFTGGHPLERLSQEVMFATLGPEVNAVIERRAGRQVLQQRPFLGNAG